MSDPDPYDRLTEAAAAAAERAVEYAAVWRTAVERNARGDYRGADLLTDIHTVMGMAMGDAAAAVAAVAGAVRPPSTEP